MSKKEKERQKQERAEIRSRNIGKYFHNFAKHHLAWLHELTERYKTAGDFPMIPMAVLPSYYTDKKDKEIAAFVTLLLKDDAGFEQIQELHEMLGDSPWGWFRKREFVRLSVGRTQDLRTGGISNWKIANLFNRLWELVRNSAEGHFLYHERIPEEYMPVLTIVDRTSRETRCDYFYGLTYLVEGCCVGDYFYKLRLLLLVLGTSDGFGIGLWYIDPLEIKSPLTSDLRTFVSTWFPDHRRYGSLDGAIHLFGFERDCDFFYCLLAYIELQRRNPKECSRYATAYHRWYNDCTRMKPHKWREIQPEIPF